MSTIPVSRISAKLSINDYYLAVRVMTSSCVYDVTLWLAIAVNFCAIGGLDYEVGDACSVPRPKMRIL